MSPRAIPKSNTLLKFIEKKLPEALKKEENNTTHVYFYKCGKDWIAVERSAYAICKKYSMTDDIMLIENPQSARFVVMILVNESGMMQMPVNVRIPLFPYCQWKKTQVDRRNTMKNNYFIKTPRSIISPKLL